VCPKKGLKDIFEAPGSDGSLGTEDRRPRGSETGVQSGARQLPRQHLYERGRRRRGVRDADSPGLEQGFDEGGVGGDGAQDRLQSGGQLLGVEGAYLAGDLPRRRRGVSPD
jgi:hypothetical protein